MLRAKGKEGKPLTNTPPYGYIHQPGDINKWIVDEEAAAVVRRIFQMVVDGMGPYRIAAVLSAEKVEKPSAYKYRKGISADKRGLEQPYAWTGTTIVHMLEKPEYMGDTVNFRYHKESYKNKKSSKNSSENIMVFKDTHDPVVDRKTWYLVQELRKTVRRHDTGGESNPLTGKLLCADCGGKMHYRRAGRRAGKDYRGMPNGKVHLNPASFYCGTYNNSKKINDRKCSAHTVQEKAVRQIILETIRYACQNVRADEGTFIEMMRKLSEVRDKSEAEKLKADLAKKEKRFTDLDLLIKKVYEDNAMGRMPDRRYEMLSSDYEREQQELEISMKEIREKLAQFKDGTDRTEEFLSLVHKYTDIQELTPAIINEFVDKVIVHQAVWEDGDRIMEIEVFLNYIGKIEIPPHELSEEETAEREKKKRQRERGRLYQQKRRARYLPESIRIISEVRQSEKEERFAEAEKMAERHLSEDGTDHIASVVSRENHIYVDSGTFPTEEEVKRKYSARQRRDRD